MQQRKALQRRTSLKRSKPLGSSGFGDLTPEQIAQERQAKKKWLSEVSGRGRARCAVCGRRRGHTQAHHVVPRQMLKRMILESQRREEPLTRLLLYDPRNGLAVCDLCHQRHEAAAQRIAYELLRPANVQFALELGVGWYIDRTYPRTEHDDPWRLTEGSRPADH